MTWIKVREFHKKLRLRTSSSSISLVLSSAKKVLDLILGSSPDALIINLHFGYHTNIFFLKFNH